MIDLHSIDHGRVLDGWGRIGSYKQKDDHFVYIKGVKCLHSFRSHNSPHDEPFFSRLNDITPTDIDLRLYEKPKYVMDDYIYLVEAPIVKLVKIGRTGNWKKRSIDYKTECPVNLKVITVRRANRRAEQYLHHVAHIGRKRGEWFGKRSALAALEEAISIGIVGEEVDFEKEL